MAVVATVTVRLSVCHRPTVVYMRSYESTTVAFVRSADQVAPASPNTTPRNLIHYYTRPPTTRLHTTRARLSTSALVPMVPKRYLSTEFRSFPPDRGGYISLGPVGWPAVSKGGIRLVTGKKCGNLYFIALLWLVVYGGALWSRCMQRS